MTTLAVRLWIGLLSLLVVAPLLAPGFVLSYDMVFVPDQAVRPDYFGLGPSLPRAIPSDAIVSLLSLVVPGQLIQKAVLVGILAGAGEGVRRVLADQPVVVQLCAVAWIVWNPYVAERLLLGQWVVLVGYAALPWVLLCACRAREGSTRAVGGAVLAVSVAAMSASGGVVAAALALLLMLLPGCRLTPRLKLVAAGAVVAVNAPWIVAGLAQAERAVSGLAAVEAFAARGEGHLPPVLTVLGLGGVWNAETVPDSRLGWTAVAWLAVLLAVVAAGLVPLWRVLGRVPATGLAGLAIGCTVIALAGAAVPSLVADVTSAVPGAALFRDGTRYLAPLALLEALAFGLGVGWVADRVGPYGLGWLVGVAMALAPLAVMPDLAWGGADRLEPVDYPSTWAAAARAVERDGSRGDVLVLPLAPYRAFPWNDSRSGLDPAPRYFDPDALVSDALVVGDVQVQGEEPRAEEAAALFEQGDLDGLGAMGVAYVVATAELEDIRRTAEAAGATQIFGSTDIDVYAVSAVTSQPIPASRLVAVIVGWALYVASITFGLALRLRRESGVVSVA